MADEKLNYDDVVIVPEPISSIRSRNECDCTDDNNMYPIFASPMSTVVDESNWKMYYDNNVNVVIPRTVPIGIRNDILFKYNSNISCIRKPFVAYSLEEVKIMFFKEKWIDDLVTTLSSNYVLRICIDIANGHMEELISTIKKIKHKYNQHIIVMSGNIANPKTYNYYEDAGCDYVRVSIGTGDACLTSSNTGVHYPIFSLLKETYEIKKARNGKCKIIADGGIRGYRDIQKALIYADYVMLGSVLNKAIESAGKTTYGKFYWNILGRRILRPIKTLIYYGREVDKRDYQKMIKKSRDGKVDIWKEFYGMSTKKAQKAIMESNGVHRSLKTSEGLIVKRKAEYDFQTWIRNEIDYLKSAMSYTNSRNLNEYKESKWVVVKGIKYNK